MAVMPWGLLESGVLTGKFLSRPSEPTRINIDKLELNEKTQTVVKEVQNRRRDGVFDVSSDYQLGTSTTKQDRLDNPDARGTKRNAAAR